MKLTEVERALGATAGQVNEIIWDLVRGPWVGWTYYAHEHTVAVWDNGQLYASLDFSDPEHEPDPTEDPGWSVSRSEFVQFCEGLTELPDCRLSRLAKQILGDLT